MPNNPKNDTPDKALVERALEIFNGGLVKEPDAKNPRGFTMMYKPAKAMSAVVAALSQPQHGGLVEAVARFLQMWDLDASGHALKGAVNNLRAALASNSPVVGEMSDADKADALWGVNDMKLRAGRPASECPPGTNTLRRPTPTDTVDRRETVALPWANVGELAEWIEQTRNKAFLNGARHDGISLVEATVLMSKLASLIAVPDGMVLVPREPTEAMLCAWATSDKVKDDWRADCRSGWSAMIAAATGEA